MTPAVRVSSLCTLMVSEWLCRQVKCRAGWPRFLLSFSLSLSLSRSLALCPIACGSGTVCVRVSVGSGCARVCHSWRSSFSLSRVWALRSAPRPSILSDQNDTKETWISRLVEEIVCLGYDERWYTGLCVSRSLRLARETLANSLGVEKYPLSRSLSLTSIFTLIRQNA